MIIGSEPVSRPVVITDEILPSPLVAEEQQHVPVISDWPEIRHRIIFAGLGVEVARDQLADVFPVREVGRPEQVVDADAVNAAFSVFEYARKRVITVVFFPYARIENAVRAPVTVNRHDGNDRVQAMFLPVDQQRVRCRRDGVPGLGAVIRGYHAVALNQCLTAEAIVLLVRVQGDRQILPPHQVFTARVTPVDVLLTIGAELVEEMVQALPLSQSISTIALV